MVDTLPGIFRSYSANSRKTTKGDHYVGRSKGKGQNKAPPHAMKTYWGGRGIAPRILDDTRYSFTTRALYPQGKTPGTRWIGGWVGPRAVVA